MKAALGGRMKAYRRRHPVGYGSDLSMAEYVIPIREDQRPHTSLPGLPRHSPPLFPRGNPTIVSAHFQRAGDNRRPGVGRMPSTAYSFSFVDRANDDSTIAALEQLHLGIGRF